MFNIFAVPPVSVGSSVFFALALLTISVVVLMLMRRFLTLRATSGYLIVPVFLALALPASVVLLVPIDLASSSRSRVAAPRSIWLPERVVLVTWRIAYWLIFCLTWFVVFIYHFILCWPLLTQDLLGLFFRCWENMSTLGIGSPERVCDIHSAPMRDISSWCSAVRLRG